MIRRFNRFELKYIVPVAVRDALIADIRQQMSVDTFGQDGVYNITSLYYDTEDLAAVRSKLDGIKYRRKVRVRAYGKLPEGPDDLVMVEIKQRINRTVQKRRLALPLRDAYALCSGSLDLERAWEDPADIDVASEITFLSRAQHLRPTAVVGYQRRAFVGGRYEPLLRVTFDQAIWCRPPTQLLSPSEERHYMLPPEWMVLEVKTDHAIPSWVSRMLARHDVTLKRFSKYCAAALLLRERGLLQPGLTGEAPWTN
ncbi:MAG: polyphosphate polymerase domain-containing protein [Polyangiaceae bacterium]|nr:polyphosphate polymerase domain-containing protein [Polyangiaceae bacterium]